MKFKKIKIGKPKFIKAIGEKKRKHNDRLLKDYNEGRILQVNNDKDNKEYFSSLRE